MHQPWRSGHLGIDKRARGPGDLGMHLPPRSGHLGIEKPPRGPRLLGIHELELEVLTLMTTVLV